MSSAKQQKTRRARAVGQWFTVLSTDDQDRTYTVLINGRRYEYWLHDMAYVEARAQLFARRRSQSQQLQWLKKNSSKYTAL